jgi:glycosyltransferase involved in cell wall biosynthesis
MTTISVVIPAYNAQSFLSRAIESALSQSLRPAEILVIDDGSSDQTFEAASAFGDRVKAFRKTNGGPASARNFGIQQAKGAWIALLDADDAWVPRKLEEQVKLIGSGVGLIHANAVGRPRPLLPEITFAQLWRRNCISTSSVLLRRETFLETGGFDEDGELVGVEDYNLWLRIAAAGWKMRGLSEELFIYAPTPASLSRQVLRFAKAELTNARRIARLLNLSAAELREKELSILDDYGLDLFYIRDLPNARNYFGEGLRRKINLERTLMWAATFLPRRFLDLRRSRAGFVTEQRDGHI